MAKLKKGHQVCPDCGRTFKDTLFYTPCVELKCSNCQRKEIEEKVKEIEEKIEQRQALLR
jgi:hypothetical protein